ncbi:MAG: SMP-30/gluconolactonase/LRE family protein [Acetobacteraceae bacterium]
MSGSVTRVSTGNSILGENPLWDPETGRVWSIDCMSRTLFRHDPSGAAQDEFVLPRTPGSFAFRAGGGMLMAYRRGLAFIEPGTPMLVDIPSPEIDFMKDVFNDGKCDRRGRFWVGTMDRETKRPIGALYRIDPDLTVHRMADGITLSNGIAFSPDDRTLYHCDSEPGVVWAYDYDIESGSIANRRVLVDFAGRTGHPDGCTIDAEGGLWVAEIGAGQIVRFDAAGRETGLIAVPVTRPTSVIFGGADLRTMFVTSMQFALSDEEKAQQPLAGSVFSVNVGVAGIPEVRFAG